MKKLLSFGIAIAAIGVAPAFANVDPKIAEFCLKAQDFKGCVASMSGKKQEKTASTPNSCPAQHLYSGGGYCQRVICVRRGLLGTGHEEDLGGKASSCERGGELTWDNNHQPIKATFSNQCPPYEPEIGYASTCEEAHHKGYVKRLGIGYMRDASGYIEEILGGAAARIGLKVGDTIVSQNGTPFREISANPSKYSYDTAGQPFTLVVRRDGKNLTFSGKIEWVNVPIKYFIEKKK